jgi:hypothetical protein
MYQNGWYACRNLLCTAGCYKFRDSILQCVFKIQCTLFFSQIVLINFKIITHLKIISQSVLIFAQIVLAVLNCRYLSKLSVIFRNCPYISQTVQYKDTLGEYKDNLEKKKKTREI